jgi:hypothetical protein
MKAQEPNTFRGRKGKMSDVTGDLFLVLRVYRGDGVMRPGRSKGMFASTWRAISRAVRRDRKRRVEIVIVAALDLIGASRGDKSSQRRDRSVCRDTAAIWRSGESLRRGGLPIVARLSARFWERPEVKFLRATRHKERFLPPRLSGGCGLG